MKTRKLLELKSEVVAVLAVHVGGETNDLGSQISNRPLCNGTKNCCKPP